MHAWGISGQLTPTVERYLSTSLSLSKYLSVPQSSSSHHQSFPCLLLSHTHMCLTEQIFLLVLVSNKIQCFKTLYVNTWLVFVTLYDNASFQNCGLLWFFYVRRWTIMYPYTQTKQKQNKHHNNKKPLKQNLKMKHNTSV